MMPGAELGHGAVHQLDRSCELLRRTPAGELVRALLPALGLGFLALALYYVERVEGIRSLRVPFAAAFAGGYMLRAHVLARWTGRRAQELLAPYHVSLEHGPDSTILRAAAWVGLDLWFWSWLLVLAVHIDAWFVPLLLPALAVRGALGPGWLACADGTSGSGIAALRRAIEQAEGQRLRGLACELMLLFASLGVAINLLALGAGAVTVGQDMLGLDLSFVSAFLSHKNHFALLFVLATSLALLDPLRAALSAVSFSEARLTRDGIALRSLVLRAEERGERGRRTGALLVLLAALSAVPARAQEPVVSDAGVAEAVVEEPCEGACARARAQDEDVQLRVDEILAEPAFTEFPEANWSEDTLGNDVISRWIDALMRWLTKQEKQEQKPEGTGMLPNVSLPRAAVFIALAVLFVVLALYLFLRKKRGDESPESEPERAQDPLDRPAEAHLADARSNAQTDLSAALRSLYLATLVGLERRGLLALSPERTNGQYLRSLPRGDDRSMFGAFTRIFDAVQYGARPPSHDDYDTCRALAERLVAGSAVP